GSTNVADTPSLVSSRTPLARPVRSGSSRRRPGVVPCALWPDAAHLRLGIREHPPTEAAPAREPAELLAVYLLQVRGLQVVDGVVAVVPVALLYEFPNPFEGDPLNGDQLCTEVIAAPALLGHLPFAQPVADELAPLRVVFGEAVVIDRHGVVPSRDL